MDFASDTIRAWTFCPWKFFDERRRLFLCRGPVGLLRSPVSPRASLGSACAFSSPFPSRASGLSAQRGGTAPPSPASRRARRHGPFLAGVSERSLLWAVLLKVCPCYYSLRAQGVSSPHCLFCFIYVHSDLWRPLLWATAGLVCSFSNSSGCAARLRLEILPPCCRHRQPSVPR